MLCTAWIKGRPTASTMAQLVLVKSQSTLTNTTKDRLCILPWPGCKVMVFQAIVAFIAGIVTFTAMTLQSDHIQFCMVVATGTGWPNVDSINLSHTFFLLRTTSLLLSKLEQANQLDPST